MTIFFSLDQPMTELTNDKQVPHWKSVKHVWEEKFELFFLS
jgi:hypothetical protein